MRQYDLWKDQFDSLTPTIESRRNSQGSRTLEGSSSSHNWEAVYTSVDTPDTLQETVTRMSLRQYELMKKEGHVSDLLSRQIQICRESWPHYFWRVIKHLTRIGQLP